MDTRTGELFYFENWKELEKAQKTNPNLVEFNCKLGCGYKETIDKKIFCRANRSQRRKIGCKIPKGKKVKE